MVDFASLASKRPGSLGDRILRFIGHWFWTLWFALAGIMYAAGSIIAMVAGKTSPAVLIAPALMLVFASIPYTWERHRR